MKATLNHEALTSVGKSRALVIAVSLLLLQALCTLSLSFWGAAEISHDAFAINLSGRQRMLSQQLTKTLMELNVARQKRVDSTSIQQEMSRAFILFDESLAALGRGSVIDRNNKTLMLDTTKSDNARDILQRANHLWAPMRAAVQPLFISSPELPVDALEKAAALILRDNQQLLSLMDDLTNEIEDAARKKSDRLRTLEALTIGSMLINFVFVLYYFRRQLRQLAESRSLLRRIMENVSTAIMVLNEKGDIELCNLSAERLFGYRLGKLAGSNIRELLDEPFFQQIGKRQNGERFSLDIDLTEITATERRLFIASLHDHTEQKLREDHLSHLAYHDPLTGLPNRQLFMDRLAQAIARAHRRQELVAVLFIDLDRFKQINDMLGHATGDLLLKEVARRLALCSREGDTVARLGGDEFTMIIDTNEAGNCDVVAQKILDELHQEFDLGGHKIRITASLGISLYPTHSSTIDSLLHHADIAMYRAKSMRGNIFCVYSRRHPPL